MVTWEIVEYEAPQYDPDVSWEVSTGIKGLRLSYREPYVSREGKKTVGMVNSLETVSPGTPYEFKALMPVRTKYGWRVRCSACGWRGYRKGYADCECYEDWGEYCRPWSPGPGCPRGILWPCPQCNGHGHDWKVSNG